MSEVKYSLNGKSFKDFGVYVSESVGLVGLLERKDVSAYDWGEYHGQSVNLRNPKFREREIELKCFIRGNDWESLFAHFRNFIIKEFGKPGTQRLHIEPMGFKTLPYEVYMKSEVVPEKTFRDGEMFATFSLKVIEPNPIKIVLKTLLDQFKLSYESTTETELFFGDGTKQTARGNVNFTKNYESPSYESSGINLISVSGVNADFYEVYTIPTAENSFRFSVEVNITAPKDLILVVIGRKLNNTYKAVAVSEITNGKTGYNSLEAFAELNMSEYGKFIYKVLDSDGNEISNLTYGNAKIETAEIIGEWQDMIGKEKIIIIAGNIEELKKLQTEAEILWDKL